MEQPDDGFLNFFLVNNVCSQDYDLVGTSTFYVYTRSSYRGLCFKKEFSSYSFVEAALTMRFCGV